MTKRARGKKKAEETKTEEVQQKGQEEEQEEPEYLMVVREFAVAADVAKFLKRMRTKTWKRKSKRAKEADKIKHRAVPVEVLRRNSGADDTNGTGSWTLLRPPAAQLFQTLPLTQYRWTDVVDRAYRVDEEAESYGHVELRDDRLTAASADAIVAVLRTFNENGIDYGAPFLG